MALTRKAPWMRTALLLAAAYNLGAGAFVALFPSQTFVGLGLEAQDYPEIWRCVGAAIAMQGVGYAIAAHAPLAHWPIVLVGLLGKVVAPIAFVQGALHGSLPWALGWLIVVNDLVWWPPFAVILWAAMQDFAAEAGSPASQPRDRAMLKHMTQQGYSLFELSQLGPTLVVFLRHAGCTFCRETLAEIARLRPEIGRRGVSVAFVTMSEEPGAQAIFDRYGLGDAPRISDPECELYRAFALRRGAWRQVFAPRCGSAVFAAVCSKGTESARSTATASGCPAYS